MLSLLWLIPILILAWLIRIAIRGTVFQKSCGCTPNIAKLEHLEKSEPGNLKGRTK